MTSQSQPQPTKTLVMMGNRSTPFSQQQTNKQAPTSLSQADFLEACATVLASAFSTDPVFNWALQDTPTDVREKEWLPMWRTLVAARQEALAPSLGIFLALEQDTNSPVATSIWYGPGEQMGTWALFRAGVFSSFYRIGAFKRLVFALGEIEESHAKTMKGAPHCYLFAIGVNQSSAGCGYGSAFGRQVLSVIDEVGNLPCYLENSNPRNIPFYQRLGFNIVEEIKAGEGGPPVFIMVRPPRSTKVIPLSIPDSSSSPAPLSRPKPQVIALPDHDKYVVDLGKKAEKASRGKSSVGKWAMVAVVGIGMVWCYLKYVK